MTLHEAIVALKPGQAIEMNIPDMENHRLVEWVRGESCPKVLVMMINRVDLDLEVRIIDLPKPQPTLYDVLVAGATKKGLSFDPDGGPCSCCLYSKDAPRCTSVSCPTALVDTLQDIALAAGFDLKKIKAAGEGGA